VLLHAIARRGQTERENSPAILLASIPPDTGNHRCRATPIFKWGSLGRLISWPAHTTIAQQGRLQRRSPFLELTSHSQRPTDKTPCSSQPVHPNKSTMPVRMGISTNSVLTRRGSPCKQNRPLQPFESVRSSRSAKRVAPYRAPSGCGAQVDQHGGRWRSGLPSDALIDGRLGPDLHRSHRRRCPPKYNALGRELKSYWNSCVERRVSPSPCQ
jgi:hypothetical protein